jgi:hypothetical protein
VRGGFVRATIALLITALLLLPGCIGGDEESGPIALKVSADNTEGHIQVVKGTNDQVISSSELEVIFDFTDTFSGDGAVQTYWLEPGDGGLRQEVNAADTNIITHQYLQHGVYDAIAGANDSAGNSAKSTIRITANMILFLNESSAAGTSDPTDVTWSTASEFSVTPAIEINLESRVVNINNFLFIESETVEVTWTAIDPEGESAGTMTTQIPEGEEDTWTFEMSDPKLGDWVLQIDVEAEDENVQTYTEIHVMYPSNSA